MILNLLCFQASLNLVSSIKDKISYFNLSIDNIYQEFASKYAFISDIKNKNYDFLNCFESDTKNKLTNFFDSLGKGFKAEQISKCEIISSELNTTLSTSKAEAKNKIRVFCAISFFICGCIIIFLI